MSNMYGLSMGPLNIRDCEAPFMSSREALFGYSSLEFWIRFSQLKS